MKMKNTECLSFNQYYLEIFQDLYVETSQISKT